MSSTSHALPLVTPDVRARPRRGTLRPSQRSRGAAPTLSVSAEGRGEAALTIGQVAHTSGISDKLIRYYESIGLIQPAARSVSGYRLYTQRDVAVLRFIKRSRSLGFSLEMIARLVALWQDQNRLSAEVRAVALDHIVAVDRKIAELRAMADLLRHLMEDCRGDERSDCPILDHLADTPHTHIASGGVTDGQVPV